jgi:hypothetical protein
MFLDLTPVSLAATKESPFGARDLPLHMERGLGGEVCEYL